MNILQSQDPELWQTIHDESIRQKDELEMIASENYTSLAVMEAMALLSRSGEWKSSQPEE